MHAHLCTSSAAMLGTRFSMGWGWGVVHIVFLCVVIYIIVGKAVANTEKTPAEDPPLLSSQTDQIYTFPFPSPSPFPPQAKHAHVRPVLQQKQQRECSLCPVVLRFPQAALGVPIKNHSTSKLCDPRHPLLHSPQCPAGITYHNLHLPLPHPLLRPTRCRTSSKTSPRPTSNSCARLSTH